MKYLFVIMVVIVFVAFVWYQKHTKFRDILFDYWQFRFSKKDKIIITGLGVVLMVMVILSYMGLRVWLG